MQNDDLKILNLMRSPRAGRNKLAGTRQELNWPAVMIE